MARAPSTTETGAAATGRPDVAASDLLRGRGEPEQQVEIQLGHLCNNRCVFCVSGQRTARGQAGVSPIEPILTEIRKARARGHEKITLLGGEPTLQPAFLDVVAECARLGFSEVVIFTNGAKTASGTLIDQALATGAPLSFRISIQGADRESHERTTLKPGSFARIERTLAHLRSRGVPTSVNMCLVASNHEEVPAFAALLMPVGVRQLHVDLMRPLDAGDRPDEELRTTLAPLDRIGAPLTAMVRAFPPGFDVNVGNLPFCLAPEIADHIHHDGQPTETIAIDGGDGSGPHLSAPWDKYQTKRRDKVKPARCRDCVFDRQCTGIYQDYLRLQGDAAIVPVSPARLLAIDPDHRWSALHAAPLLGRLASAAARDGAVLEVSDRGLTSVQLAVTHGDTTRLAIVPPRQGTDGHHTTFSLRLEKAEPRSLAWLAAQLGAEPTSRVPLHDERQLAPPMRAALRRLAGAAPFGTLRWTAVHAAARDRAELTFAADASTVTVALSLDGAGKVKLGYTVGPGAALEPIRAGLRALLLALAGAPSAHP